MISKNEINKRMLFEIESHLNDFGFRKNNAKQNLSRNTLTGKDSFHLGIIATSHGIQIEPDIAMRLSILEDLIRDNTSGFVVGSSDRFTIGTFFKNLLPDTNSKWLILNSNEVEKVASNLSYLFIEYGLPFFEKHSEPRCLFQLLIGDDKMAEELCIVPLNRALNTVGLAFLLNETKTFLSLGKEFEGWLASIPGSDASTFNEFFDNLKQK